MANPSQAELFRHTSASIPSYVDEATNNNATLAIAIIEHVIEHAFLNILSVMFIQFSGEILSSLATCLGEI